MKESKSQDSSKIRLITQPFLVVCQIVMHFDTIFENEKIKDMDKKILLKYRRLQSAQTLRIFIFLSSWADFSL